MKSKVGKLKPAQMTRHLNQRISGGKWILWKISQSVKRMFIFAENRFREIGDTAGK